MKVQNTIWFLLLAISSIFASCSKDKTNSQDQLPPATQTGAGTFGCKINGKVFIPKGNNRAGTPNPKVQYDFDLNGQPYLSIETNIFSQNSSLGILVFRNLNNLGFYSVDNNLKFTVGWPEMISNCGAQTLDTSLIKYGGGFINKIDIPNRIISGTYDFKYKTLQCDTVRITEGLFDIKF